MALFTIRVELQGAQPQHYTNLLNAFAQVGVGDVLSAENGTKWKLPTGQYAYVGNENMEQVVNAVKSIANSVLATNAVLVTQADSVSWNGLEQVA